MKQDTKELNLGELLRHIFTSGHPQPCLNGLLVKLWSTTVFEKHDRVLGCKIILKTLISKISSGCKYGSFLSVGFDCIFTNIGLNLNPLNIGCKGNGIENVTA